MTHADALAQTVTRKRWTSSENAFVAKAGWLVTSGQATEDGAARWLAGRVGGTPGERKINVRAAVNAILGRLTSYPRASSDLVRAVRDLFARLAS